MSNVGVLEKIRGLDIQGTVNFPSRQLKEDCQSFWGRMNARLVKQAGRELPDNQLWTIEGTVGEPVQRVVRSFENVTAPGVGIFSGSMTLTEDKRNKGEPTCNALIVTKTPIDKNTREQLARQIIPEELWKSTSSSQTKLLGR